ncbi:MAG: DUF456 domain-containing protein [Anaerolineaceae bacterium]
MVEYSVTYWVVFVVSLLLNVSGLLSLLLVFFPGLTVVWLGQLVWVIATGFNRGHEPWQFGLTIAIFVVSTILMIVGGLIDNVLMAKGTMAKKTPWWVVVVTWVCMVVGGILLNPIGGLALSLLVLFLFEYFRNDKDQVKAFESTKGWVTGWGTAAIVRLVMAVVMLLLWLFEVAVL